MAKFKGKNDSMYRIRHGDVNSTLSSWCKVSPLECGRLSSERESNDLLAEASVREGCRIYCCYPFKI